MANERRQELAVGALMIVAAGVLAWMALQVGALGSLGPAVHVTLRMTDAAGIQAGASVAMYGVEVGRVTAMRLEPDAAVAELELAAKHRVPKGVVPAIRARSVLGEKYVQLQPSGDPTALLADGDVLTISGEQIEIDEMVQKAGVVASAVDAEALAEAVRIVIDALKEDPARMERAFDHLDAMLANGDAASARLVEVLDHADRTLSGVDAAVAAASSRLAEARAPLAKADEVLASLRAPAARADAVMDDAAALLASGRSAADKLDGMLAGLDGVDADVRTILRNVAEIDKWELRRLLREEGILIRVKPDEVVPSPTRTEDVVPAARR